MWKCLPGLRSSKSDSILKAVQGFTPSVAAASKGMSFGSVMTSCSDNTASVLHVPAHTKGTQTLRFHVVNLWIYVCDSSRCLPRPASFGMTQSPVFRDFTWLPTSTTWATPSLPPTAGRSGRIAYVPERTTDLHTLQKLKTVLGFFAILSVISNKQTKYLESC